MQAIALKYSAGGKKAVLLRIRTTNFMDRGAALRWISAFPHEDVRSLLCFTDTKLQILTRLASQEYLYPPTTFLKPKYDTPEQFMIDDVRYEVVDVTAQMS